MHNNNITKGTAGSGSGPTSGRCGCSRGTQSGRGRVRATESSQVRQQGRSYSWFWTAFEWLQKSFEIWPSFMCQMKIFHWYDTLEKCCIKRNAAAMMHAMSILILSLHFQLPANPPSSSPSANRCLRVISPMLETLKFSSRIVFHHLHSSSRRRNSRGSNIFLFPNIFVLLHRPPYHVGSVINVNYELSYHC